MESLISVSPEICHGQPCINGTRIMVWQLLELLETGITAEQICSQDYFPQLKPEHIKAALHFASEQFRNREFIAFNP